MGGPCIVKRQPWNPYGPEEEARKLQERREELARREAYDLGTKIKLEAEEEESGLHIDSSAGVDFVNRRFRVVSPPRLSSPPSGQQAQGGSGGRIPSSGSGNRLAALTASASAGSIPSSPRSVGTQGTLSPGGEARLEQRLAWHQAEMDRLQARLQRWGPSWGGGSASMGEAQGSGGEQQQEGEEEGEEEEGGAEEEFQGWD